MNQKGQDMLIFGTSVILILVIIGGLVILGTLSNVPKRDCIEEGIVCYNIQHQSYMVGKTTSSRVVYVPVDCNAFHEAERKECIVYDSNVVVE